MKHWHRHWHQRPLPWGVWVIEIVALLVLFGWIAALWMQL